jgi:uroporphyrin-III C-methyltransferase/precorrin-2 dehydrogenase/sirohydrochlorin ferrochelatase/uroporphyrin-III C-methyltransferase
LQKVFLVGAGPGDPDLLTVKAARLLGQAEVVLYDSLPGPAILALAPAQAELIDVGKRCGKAAMPQAQICRLIVEKARAGRRVVRLKGGDAMVFGRATEEMDALRAAGLAFEVVPGITAASAAAASLQVSLTKRGVSRGLHIVTGHDERGALPGHDWAALAHTGGTLAVYMGSKTLAGMAAHLIETGMNPATPAVAVESASLPGERVMAATLGTLPLALQQARAKGPVLLLIGEALRGVLEQARLETAETV